MDKPRVWKSPETLEYERRRKPSHTPHRVWLKNPETGKFFSVARSRATEAREQLLIEMLRRIEAEDAAKRERSRKIKKSAEPDVEIV